MSVFGHNNYISACSKYQVKQTKIKNLRRLNPSKDVLEKGCIEHESRKHGLWANAFQPEMIRQRGLVKAMILRKAIASSRQKQATPVVVKKISPSVVFREATTNKDADDDSGGEADSGDPDPDRPALNFHALTTPSSQGRCEGWYF